MLAPIILFVYNRPWHTRQTVEALQKNELASESELYIFADGPKVNATENQIHNINEVRDYIHTINGFKKVIINESKTNKGLANSIIEGVTRIINLYNQVIVVEDDIITHPYFLRYMNDMLDYYKNTTRIYQVGAYKYNFKIPFWYSKKIFALYSAECWGWGTWKDRWINIDWELSDYNDFIYNKKKTKSFCRSGNNLLTMLIMQKKGEIDSWWVRYCYNMFKKNSLCIRPTQSLTQNIGFDNSGVHCGYVSYKEIPALYEGIYKIKPYKNIYVNRIIANRHKHSQDHTSSIWYRILYSLNKRLHLIRNCINKQHTLAKTDHIK